MSSPSTIIVLLSATAIHYIFKLITRPFSTGCRRSACCDRHHVRRRLKYQKMWVIPTSWLSSPDAGDTFKWNLPFWLDLYGVDFISKVVNQGIWTIPDYSSEANLLTSALNTNLVGFLNFDEFSRLACVNKGIRDYVRIIIYPYLPARFLNVFESWGADLPPFEAATGCIPLTCARLWHELCFSCDDKVPEREPIERLVLALLHTMFSRIVGEEYEPRPHSRYLAFFLEKHFNMSWEDFERNALQLIERIKTSDQYENISPFPLVTIHNGH